MSLFVVDEQFAEALAGYRWQEQRSGYLIRASKTSAGRKTLCLHREVWLLAYGQVPVELNHKNGLKYDCRLENLEPATRRLNNLDRRYRGRDLPTGVYRQGEKYRARLGPAHLGTFSTPEDASAAYVAAKNQALSEERKLA
jgi:hypothetical protein